MLWLVPNCMYRETLNLLGEGLVNLLFVFLQSL